MNGRNVSAELTAEQMQQARAALQTLSNLMPFLINLPPEEKGSLARISPDNIDFVKEAYAAAQKFAHVLPPTIDVPEFGRDLNLFINLTDLRQDIAGFTSQLDDTIAEVGAEAYFTARYIYRQLQLADKAGVPGLKAILERLGQRFEKQGTGKKKKDSIEA